MNGAERVMPDSQVPVVELEREAPAKYSRRSRLIGKAVLQTAAMLTASAAVFGMYEFQADVNENRAILANTHPYLLENAPAPSNQLGILPVPRSVFEAMDPSERTAIDEYRQSGSMGVVNFSGVGRTQIPNGGDVMAPFNRYAANLSMVYDRKGIDTGVMANTLNILTDKNGTDITDFIIYGNSAGAPIGTDTAVKLIKGNPRVRVRAIILDSGAFDASVVRPESRREGLMMLEGLKVPGISESRYARVLGEMIMRHNQIHDIGSLINTYNLGYKEAFDSRTSLSNSLVGDQFTEILDSPMQKDLNFLGTLPKDQRPLIFFISASDPSRDDVVDVNKSFALLKEWTGEAGLTLAGRYGIENSLHGEPELNESQYHRIFQEQIIPAIQQRADTGSTDVAVGSVSGD